MGKRTEQLRFVRDFYSERARIQLGARLRKDPLCRLHLDEGRRDPYPLYADVRARGPVWRSSLGPWTSATHQVCNEILRNRQFGVTTESSNAETGSDDGAGQAGERGPAGSPQLSFLELNPPDHTRLRRLVMPSFSPRSVAAFEPMIEKVVDDLLDRASVVGAPFDLVTAFAAPMPIAVITELLGVPDADAAEFATYGATFGSALGGLQSLRHAGELMRAQKALARIFESVFESRRRDPGDDLISRLVAAEGGTVSADELVPLCTLLLIAGFETTVNLIGNTVLALLDHPDAWRRVVDDPRLVDAAVEETLRWDSPVQRTGRVALVDQEIAGQMIKKGEFVVTLLGGANRDPAVFTDPDVFDLDRPAKNDHLAFSGGIHYCVGAPLAKLEAVIAVRSIVARFPDLRQVGDLARRQGSLIRGMTSFPVAGTPTSVVTS